MLVTRKSDSKSDLYQFNGRINSRLENNFRF